MITNITAEGLELFSTEANMWLVYVAEPEFDRVVCQLQEGKRKRQPAGTAIFNTAMAVEHANGRIAAGFAVVGAR